MNIIPELTNILIGTLQEKGRTATHDKYLKLCKLVSISDSIKLHSNFKKECDKRKINPFDYPSDFNTGNHKNNSKNNRISRNKKWLKSHKLTQSISAL